MTNNDNDNSSAAFETLTVSTISQTIVDFPPIAFSVTYSLVPDPVDNPVVPMMLAPANVMIESGDNLAAQEDVAPVSVFLPEPVVEEAACTLSNGTVDPLTSNCNRRIHFTVFTSTLFFSEVRGEMVESEDGSPPTVVRTAQSEIISPNSLVVSIQIERVDTVLASQPAPGDVLAGGQRRLAAPIRISLRPISGQVRV